MSDLCPISYFLRIEVITSEKGFCLSQSKYIYDLMARSSITNNRTVATPMELHMQLRLLMVHPLRIPLDIFVLWAVLFISPPPDLILLMQFIF